MPINALFENPAGQPLGVRPLTADEKEVVREAAECALEAVGQARLPRAMKVARWLGVLSPTQSYALTRGVDAMYGALDTRGIAFAAGTPGVSNLLRHGTAIDLPWMAPAAFGCLHVSGTHAGGPIRVVLEHRFFSSSPKRMMLTVLHELSHCVLGTGDVNWLPLGMAYDVALSQQLAARYPGWAMRNAENWAFYLSSYLHDWP